MATNISHSPGETESLGETWGRTARKGLVIALSGDLGAGKTQLVKGIARALGITQKIQSPTFALINEYSSGRLPLFHLDLYRLESTEQLTNLGWDEIVSSRALVLIEWPERAGSRLPDDHLPIDLDYVPDDPARRILLAG